MEYNSITKNTRVIINTLIIYNMLYSLGKSNISTSGVFVLYCYTRLQNLVNQGVIQF